MRSVCVPAEERTGNISRTIALLLPFEFLKAVDSFFLFFFIHLIIPFRKFYSHTNSNSAIPATRWAHCKTQNFQQQQFCSCCLHFPREWSPSRAWRQARAGCGERWSATGAGPGDTRLHWHGNGDHTHGLHEPRWPRSETWTSLWSLPAKTTSGNWNVFAFSCFFCFLLRLHFTCKLPNES